ncbi:hypothetical protein [Nocardioides massiliensis]|uniref:ABC transporter permease n=1 Tax=Nocardioides massiliensis TaxID=1325935 RepID=A0ABT9NT60_9ACTN|nr:hypothetical protein [Nocardioides massiliensis]MDP9823614.1 hypothetical protein [Nocardioides massiliensis]
MTRLLGVELTRFRSRRAIALLLLTGLVITVVVAGATAWNTRGVTDRELREAEQTAMAEAEQPYVQDELEACRENPGDWGVPADDCEGVVVPQPEWFLHRTPLDLGQERQGSGIGAATVLAGIAIMVGATFAGADWSSGSMSNQLLFESRRVRVWLAKALAVVLGVALLTLVALAALWGFYFAVASARDVTVAPGTTELIRGDVLRAVALSAAAGLGGYALSMLFRSTTGTVAVVFVVAVAGEILTSLLPIEGRMRFSPSSNVFAVLQDGVEVYDQSLPCAPDSGNCGFLTVGAAHGATYLACFLALAVLLSVWSFRHRDVP